MNILQTIADLSTTLLTIGLAGWQCLRAESMRASKALTINIYPLEVNEQATTWKFKVVVMPGSEEPAYRLSLLPLSQVTSIVEAEDNQLFIGWLGFEECRRAQATMCAPLGSSAWFIIRWSTPSIILRRPVGNAIRLRISSTDSKFRYFSPQWELESWRWYRTAWIRVQLNRFLPHKMKFALGKFVSNSGNVGWYSRVPDDPHIR